MEGSNEVRMILYKIYNMIIGEGIVEIGTTSKIFKKKPGLCWDNYFSGDNFYFIQGRRDMVCCHS